MSSPHAILMLAQHDAVQLHVKYHATSKPLSLTGDSLTQAGLVAAVKHLVRTEIRRLTRITDGITASCECLRKELESGSSIYGVTTGFGGSADTTTTSTRKLQVALLQMQTCGVLPLPNCVSTHDTTSLSMPEAWVRGAMIIRANSLLRGHSALRLSVIEDLVTLIQENLIPFIPLRGSISASGDLSPLSYIASCLEGNPDIYVWSGKPEARTLIRADEALKLAHVRATTYEPKEVLAIVNGTAISASVTALATFEAHLFLGLAQILTAATVEALLGSADSFDPFFANVRPHPGQVEVARNMKAFLSGSKLVHSGKEGALGHPLAQDRYATRTSSQWLGPLLEDLLAAQFQIDIELNSTTDNLLIDTETGTIHYGGNFQAASMTSATEKTRYSLHMIGRMIFAQSSELLNVQLSNGLPPNLAPDEPSTSYTAKGLDINMAAYMAELAFLGNPVSTHVQTAEMGNQAINSLALLSARKTHESLDVLGLMLATHIWTCCQALDLRAMQARCEAKLFDELESITACEFGNRWSPELTKELLESAFTASLSALKTSTTLDCAHRSIHVARVAGQVWMELPERVIDPAATSTTFQWIQGWIIHAGRAIEEIFQNNRAEYFANPDACPYLGAASQKLYTYVRKDLGVPFCRGLVDHPTYNEQGVDSKDKKTIGHQVSIIYAALREGKMSEVICDCFRTVT